MNKFRVGQFVRYKIKNEIGLVGEVSERGARVWYAIGGTRSMSPFDIIEPLTINQVFTEEFSNEYAKASLIERRLRLYEGRDVSDLIDENHIRSSVFKELQNFRHKEEDY